MQAFTDLYDRVQAARAHGHTHTLTYARMHVGAQADCGRGELFLYYDFCTMKNTDTLYLESVTTVATISSGGASKNKGSSLVVTSLFVF